MVDAKILLTCCLELYVIALRRVFPERLKAAFGDAWWDRGVLEALDVEGRRRLKEEIERNPGRDYAAALGPTHFWHIAREISNEIFPDLVFNRFEVIKRMRNIIYVRNYWAHQQEVSFSLALQAAGWMKDVLIELKCAEALRIEGIMNDHAIEPTIVAEAYAMDTVEPPVDDDDLPPPDERETLSGPASLWHELRQHLEVEVHVDLPEEEQGPATVTVRMHNAAPNDPQSPEVHFRAITVRPVGGGNPIKGSGNIPVLGPGNAAQAQFSFPPRQLLNATFDVDAEVDMERYFRFTAGATIPEDVVAPIRQEFMAWWDAVNVKEFAEGIEAELTGFHEKMPMDELQSRDAALNCRIQELQGKLENLSKLYSHFELRDTGPLARRVKELVADMRALEERLNELKGAMSSYNMEEIATAVESVKGVRLAVLRLEVVVRSASGP